MYLLLCLISCSGSDSEPTPPAEPPQISTSVPVGITYTSAKGGVSVIANRPYVSKGFCWGKSPNPSWPLSPHKDDFTEKPSFESTMELLDLESTYFVRGYVDTGEGIIYGDEKVFSTKEFLEGPTDIDGNTYRAVQIGNQIWMAENLKVGHYTNGEEVPYVIDNTEWGQLNSGAWSMDQNVANFQEKYGRWYNWFAVSDPRKLCPTGWHVPSKAEIDQLFNTMGGFGANLRVQGEWKTSSIVHVSTNTTGFSMRPSGYRLANSMSGHTEESHLWSSTPQDSYLSYRLDITWGDELFIWYSLNTTGYSVRCVKD